MPTTKCTDTPKSVKPVSTQSVSTVCGTYCTDFLTDGLVPLWYIQTWPNGTKLANHLVQTGFWEEAPDGDYQFLSWDEYQRTRTKVIAEREKARMRKQKWRDEHPDARI